MKYEYMLDTWGGFYNENHKAVHGKDSGYHYFDTSEERDKYIEELRKIEKKLNAKSLMISLEEGFHTRIKVVAHRLTEYNGKTHHTTYEFPPCYPYEVAVYHLENKWYLGFNDYPLGEDFDYSDPKVFVVSEWIEGAFSL